MYRFCNPPIVIVTDRKQLDEQIHGTFKSCGFPDPIAAKSRNHLQQLLSNPKGKTIMTTIQKFGSQEKHVQTEQKVIALVDEAHRTQYKFNAQAMRAAMPNAVFFAFSGTPIDKKNRSTYRVFGPLLDKYSTYQTNSSKKYFIFLNKIFMLDPELIVVKKVWETCTFSDEIVSGDLKLHKFAVELHQFLDGQADPVYQDPELFLKNTFLTSQMKFILKDSLLRLTRGFGTPVTIIDTGFGGGKTHRRAIAPLIHNPFSY